MRGLVSLTLPLSLVVACGSNPAHPAGTAKLENKASPVPPTAARADAAKDTCEGAARLLVVERGFGAIPPKNQDGARRGAEAEIVAACVDDQWDKPALECMASRPSPASCIGQLSQYQESSYEAHLTDWERNWTTGPGAAMAGGGDNPCGGGGEEGGVEGGDMAGDPNSTPPKQDWVQCQITDAADFEPVIKSNAPDHDFALLLRKNMLDQACEGRWGNPDKTCFNAAKDAAAVATCRTRLDEPGKNALDNSLAEADAKMKRLAALEKTPRAIDCKAVTAVHYSDDVWRGKLVSLSAKERKRVIDESRDALTKVCTDEKWSAVERACMVSSTRRDYDMMECFPDDKHGRSFRFAFPASGVTFKTGIPECDKLGEVVKKIASCDKIEKELRDGLVDSYGMQMSNMLDSYGSMKDEVVKSCKESIQMYTEGAKARGCDL